MRMKEQRKNSLLNPARIITTATFRKTEEREKRIGMFGHWKVFEFVAYCIQSGKEYKP